MKATETTEEEEDEDEDDKFRGNLFIVAAVVVVVVLVLCVVTALSCCLWRKVCDSYSRNGVFNNKRVPKGDTPKANEKSSTPSGNAMVTRTEDAEASLGRYSRTFENGCTNHGRGGFIGTGGILYTENGCGNPTYDNGHGYPNSHDVYKRIEGTEIATQQ